MIARIRHRGLRQLYRDDDARGLTPHQVPRIRRILTVLDRAEEPSDMQLPGFRLHRLRGDRQGFWAVDVSGNWRITFRFEGNQPTDVDLVDYH